MGKMLLALGALLLIAFVLGLRIHPDAFQEKISGGKGRSYQKVVFKSGRTFVGEVVHETPEKIRIKVEGGILDFSKNEIASTLPVDRQSASAVSYGGETVSFSEKPMVTFRREDSFFYKPEVRNFASALGPKTSTVSAAPAVPTAPTAAANPQPTGMTPEMMQTYLQAAQNVQAAAEQKRQQQEAMVKQMEEG